uniref:Uncharacterized protein n=1 Tax=Janibacter limosus TaxID=53458 RepID=A0AC61U6B2_9MICO|nr:hypothetical protein [Janibacter limosus]
MTRDTPGPTSLDDARTLVPEHHRQACLEVAVCDVDVGVAQAGVGVLDQHLTLARFVRGELLDLDALAGLDDDCCPGLHEVSSGWVIPP